MTSITSIQSLTLDLPPSCIAFCPSRPQYLVTGTYYLHPNEQADASTVVQAQAGENDDSPGDVATNDSIQRRSGSLILFRLHGERITQLGTKETDFAILDAQWAPDVQGLGDCLAVATSTGLIAFYKLQAEDESGDLVFLGQKSVADASTLVLSMAWHPCRKNAVGITLSNGKVCLCEVREGNLWDADASVQIKEIHTHDLEAWTLAFVGEKPTAVVSGGDDIVMRCSKIEDQSLLWQDRKSHQAGVTAILPLTAGLHATGSYDDHIRLITVQPNSRPRVQAELDLGGGVWRLRLLNQSPHVLGEGAEDVADPTSWTIVASCMHAGSRVVHLHKERTGKWAFEVVAKFEEHQSMNYGSDIQPSDGTLKSIVSTSFYDKLFCLWQFDIGDIARV